MNYLKFLAFTGMLYTFLGQAQDNAQTLPRDPETNKFTCEEIVQVDSASTRNLFDRGALWLERQFKTQQLNVRNIESGILSHNGSFPVSFVYAGRTQENQMLYTLTIAIKDGRYKYTFTDFILSENATGTTRSVTLESYCDQKGNKATRRVQGEYQQQVDAEVKKIATDLITALAGSDSIKDKW
jgi:hypothetical protein